MTHFLIEKVAGKLLVVKKKTEKYRFSAKNN